MFLIHWNKPEAEELAKPFRVSGWKVACEWEDGARAGRNIVENAPDVIVIYHSRLPSHGRATAEGLRALKATRHIPIVFVDGEGEALEKTRAKVPGAIFTTSAKLRGVVAKFSI